MLQLNSIVKNKKYNTYGTVEYSRFGYSIHEYTYEDDHMILGKSLAMSEEKVLQLYDVVDLPEGYYVGDIGGVLKKNLTH